MSAHERTGWRDEAISKRHRGWGFNCPAVDLDFLMVEYNLGKPVALVEYKYVTARIPNVDHPTYSALDALANASGIPFFIAVYNKNPWWFRITAVNENAHQIFSKNEILSEYDYVRKLYQIRSIAINEHVLSGLSRYVPRESAA